MIVDQLINKKFHILQRQKILKDNEKFIYNETAKRTYQGLDGINLNLSNCLELGFTSKNIYNYFLDRFGDIDYSVLDISDKIIKNLPSAIKSLNFDHDTWNLNKTNFDLIISNFYIHISNNIDILIGNINQSLNPNGFFIATLPGMNCFNELKNVMIKTDIELYQGAYRRFIELLSIDMLSKLLKKHNFRIPLLEIDTFYLKYKDFSKLLRDVRYLGNSNVYFDRKKSFETKRYFTKAEELYWQFYSNNEELILTIEVLIISGWKEHYSQQQPLKPGSAKISLKKALK